MKLEMQVTTITGARAVVMGVVVVVSTLTAGAAEEPLAPDDAPQIPTPDGTSVFESGFSITVEDWYGPKAVDPPASDTLPELPLMAAPMAPARPQAEKPDVDPAPQRAPPETRVSEEAPAQDEPETASEGTVSPVSAPGVTAGDETVECQLLYETADGIYVDIGTHKGLEERQQAWLQRGPERLVRVEVNSVANRTAFLRTLTPLDEPIGGGALQLVLDSPLIPKPAAVAKEKPRTLKGSAPDEFVPLLATPESLMNSVRSEVRNLFQGQMTVRQYSQATDGNNNLDFYRLYASTAGSLERIGGSAWAFEWSGNVNRRSGDVYDDSERYNEPDYRVYEAAFARRYENGSLLRVGRFIPHQLPSAGMFDGLHAEQQAGDHARLGAILGMRPDVEDLSASSREATVVPYGTLEYGQNTDRSYSTTAGVLASAYEGDFDRLAILFDQAARIGRVSLFSSAEVDFDPDDLERVDVTRFDFSTSFAQTSALRWRLGVNRWRPLDTESYIEAFGYQSVEAESYTRVWVGSSQRLSKEWMLNERLSFTDSSGGEDDLRWRLGVTKWGILDTPGSSAHLSFFNLVGDDNDGYAMRLSALLPTKNYGVLMEPSVGFRYHNLDTGDEDALFMDLGMRAHWTISKSLTVSSGFTYTTTEQDNGFAFDIGITLWW